MSEVKIYFQPGVNTVQTELGTSARSAVSYVSYRPFTNTYAQSNRIRFFEGYLQPLYGWDKFNPTALTGVCRAMHPWQDLSAFQYLMCGTNSRLQIYTGGTQYDVTPIEKSDTLTNGFSTVINIPTVTITDTAHGASAGDWINVEIPIQVGGLVVFGYYAVASVVDANHYTITATSNATSTVTNGGTTPQFNTTNGQSTVTVTLINHGYVIGQTFTVQVSTSIAGLTLLGGFLVNTVPSSSTFTITASGNANATTSTHENSGNAIVQYLLPSGLVSSAPSSGWGTGTWGSGAWGQSTGSAQIIPLRIWSLDNFGQNGLALPTNGALYQWVPPASVGNVATVISQAPTASVGMFVSQPAEIVVCWGSESGGTQDPLLIRWSDAGDDTDWTPDATNQAGSFRLSRGSRIVGACQGPMSGLFWTDLDLWIQNYTQLPYVFSIQTASQNCGLIAQNAFGILGQITYWMGLKEFFLFDGNSVQVVPCTVWDNIFGNLDLSNVGKIFCASDTPFQELFWFYPSASGGTGEIDSYVKLNIQAGAWDYGSLIRTAWIDQNIFGMPLAVDSNGFVQQHETGYSDNGAQIANIFAQSGYVDITEGQDFPYVDRVIPDVKQIGNSSSLTVYVYGKNYPADTPAIYGPYTIADGTSFITTRIRKRQISILYQWSGTGGFQRLSGTTRVRIAPSGRR